MNIVIVKYNAGNVASVQFSLARLGIEAMISDNVEVIAKADKVIFPGVGEASSAMHSLKSAGLDTVIAGLHQPVLGICLGMQLMCTHSEEGNTRGLGIFPALVKRIDAGEEKVPHMGWNTIYNLSGALYKGVPPNAYVYYVHSFCAEVCEATTALTTCGQEFSASLQRDNFYGVQYHPEKSGVAGEFIIRNFLEL